MTQLNRTFERTPILIPVAGLLLATALVIGALASGFDGGAGTGRVPAGPVAPPIAAPRTDRVAIRAQLQSEYLRDISAGWYVKPQRTDPAAIRAQLQSEYLREISEDWYRGDGGTILDRLYSDYLRKIAADW
jgi:hypothetical protein